MKKPVLTFLFFVLATMYGCTPSSEDIAGKGDPRTYGREEIDTLAVASGESPELLDVATERFIRTYGPTIKRYSERYGFDWRLVLAIMKQESRFSRVAESHMGAEGLMQLMPVTGEEMARKLDLDDLSHPEHNIEAGIYYLRELYNLFEGSGEADRLKLTLAAYNAGLSRVFDAQELASYLQEKPTQWQSVKDALPLLSKRYYTLHRSVWGQDKPKSGWFGNAGQTLKYVDSVMDYYDDFRLALN
jgi:membrane-bound lytic murein transglycosylase F